MQGKNKETEVTEQLLQVTVLLLLQLHNNDIYYHRVLTKDNSTNQSATFLCSAS